MGIFDSIVFDIVLIIVFVVIALGIYLYEIGIIGYGGKALNNLTVSKTTIPKIAGESSSSNINVPVSVQVLNEIKSMKECPATVNRGMILVKYPKTLPCYTPFVRVGRGLVDGQAYNLYYNAIVSKTEVIITFSTEVTYQKTIIHVLPDLYEFRKIGFVTVTSFTPEYFEVMGFKLFQYGVTSNNVTLLYYVIYRNTDSGPFVLISVCPPEFFSQCYTYANKITS